MHVDRAEIVIAMVALLIMAAMSVRIVIVRIMIVPIIVVMMRVVRLRMAVPMFMPMGMIGAKNPRTDKIDHKAEHCDR